MASDDNDIPNVIAPPPLIYIVPLLAGLLLHRWFPRDVVSPMLAQWLGAACLALGLVMFPALNEFRRAKTNPKPWRPTTALVIQGPYRFTRNPMYVGFTLIYLGIAFWLNALWPVLLLPVALLIVDRGVIAREERYLERKFGAEYLAYRARVRRWL